MVPIITVDGPSGAGKGSLCSQLAQQLHWPLLDSGAIYRVLAHAALEQGIPLEDEAALAQLALALELQFLPDPEGTKVLLNQRDVSAAIRLETAGNAASKVAALPQVRAALLERQRRYAMPPGLIADGRDMGTVVFPEAALKIFLDASPEERALRRWKQLQAIGINVNVEELIVEIKERDHRDRTRASSPLVPASEAIVIDSTGLSLAEVLACVLDLVKARKLA